MKIISSVYELTLFLGKHSKKMSLGFVPTMGALHQGHLSLLKKSRSQNELSLCSIFINPTQFNNKADLKNYPSRLKEDIKLLGAAGCDVVFTPPVSEIYPGGLPSEEYDFGQLDKVMEGVQRPGHFNGVAMVVARFFEIIQPQRAYFGEKDYQQLAIIRSLAAQKFKNIEIVSCPTLREKSGLAMSSRNLLLNERYQIAAQRIYQRLLSVKKRAKNANVAELELWVANEFKKDGDLVLEYFEIVDAKSLKKSTGWSDFPEHVACLAVFAGTTRLIDNILLKIN
ncbi:MAG: pantoate--beta-alanine ligase [Bacteroidetes bacterium MED-G21]|nr:MAG: pantoate--beta-alanine ligase [Bacteroidetes bacterium MED-G21]